MEYVQFMIKIQNILQGKKNITELSVTINHFKSSACYWAPEVIHRKLRYASIIVRKLLHGLSTPEMRKVNRAYYSNYPRRNSRLKKRCYKINKQ